MTSAHHVNKRRLRVHRSFSKSSEKRGGYPTIRGAGLRWNTHPGLEVVVLVSRLKRLRVVFWGVEGET